jgi:putative addiction module killer protein
MKIVKTTAEFDKWFDSLRDGKTKSIIRTRMYRAEDGNYGDYKSVGDNVLEMRIFYGAGYRLYFTERGKEIIIMLAGGDKSTQTKDINKAVEISKLL